MSTLSPLRRYVAGAISPRITTQHIPTSSDKVDSAFAQVAEDSVELLSTYLGTDQADVGQEKMANIARRHPEAMELLQTLSKPGIPMGFEAGPGSTFSLQIVKSDDNRTPLNTVYVDTTPDQPGIEVVGVAHRKSTIFLDAEL